VLCSKPDLDLKEFDEALEPDCCHIFRGDALDSPTSSFHSMVLGLVEEVRISSSGLGDDNHTCNLRTQH
jgi:hypothetical protein